MEAIEELFQAAGIPFCRHGNRIRFVTGLLLLQRAEYPFPSNRCFPHVINVAVQTILKELKENGYDPIIATSADPLNPSSELMEYATAVQSDPVGRTRQIVATCRKSGQGREGLQKLIATSNDTNTWGPDTNIRLVQLLRDCETRWSSTFNMIDRVIELYPVRNFCIKTRSDSSCFSLSNTFFRNPICSSTDLNFSHKRNAKYCTTSIKYSKYRINATNSYLQKRHPPSQ